MQIELSLIIVFLAIVTALILAARDKSRTILDPVYVSSATFALLFFARPLYDYIHNSFVWVNIPVDHVMPQVMTAVAIAVVMFYVGNLLHVGQRLAIALPSPPHTLRGSVAIVIAYGLFFGSIALRLVSAELAGGISTLFVRRENLAQGGTTIPFVDEAFLIVVPAFLLFVHLIPRYKYAAAIGALASSAIVLQTALVGNRRYLLVLGTTAAAYIIFSRRIKPKFVSILTIAVITFFAFIAPIELTRSQERSYLDAALLGFKRPVAVVEELLLVSQSTSLVNSFGLVVNEYGSDAPSEYRYGVSTLAETVLQPIPGEIWPEKPEPVRTMIINKYWGIDRGGCISLCPTFSALATFYSDFGLLAVGLGSFLCGILLRIPSAYLHRFSENFLAQAAMSIIVPVPFFIWWGSLSSLVLTVGTGLLPLIFVSVVGRQDIGKKREDSISIGTATKG